ncbi:MAG: bifunctional (p)ppGpp synthetase/guanosine-3',5'-bis(diphosphate) 3'-pyrophosphohydrolase, partial [Defluviitaleaceae bacterium]|nr:bifunctional (p)ppGpp synthetase/guanosine-3',5'-bis(diphosphate) 3'-pyrophosphohydrolase [Defluviitaleaceae bacterium]
MENSIKFLYDKLIATIRTYRPLTPLTMVEKAFEISHEAHKNCPPRKTGEPFVTHPLEVAIILAEIRTDTESIAAGLLHDVVEDTHFTLDDIREKFGDDVALLVDGVTKIKTPTYVTKTEQKVENYRKLFFHIAQDVRVLLIKIADRLHNMRTLEGHSREQKQIDIAQETLEIYAPLAHRLGISKLRYELEDLGFKYTNRETYDELSEKVALKHSERDEIVEQIMLEIRTRLEKYGMKATVEGRTKQLYSIHKKMVVQGKPFEKIHDVYAVRVLVEEIGECYYVMGVLHEMYKPVPGRLKDYIGMKKANGYQSIHTTLSGPAGEPFEVQIRTYGMHEVAQYGIAAHWKYKEGDKAAKDQWLKEIMEWQRRIKESKDSVHALKTDLSAFHEKIFCFTPKSEPIQLIKGACVIDFAYAVHSSVGNRMTGAKVNNKIVPLDFILETGDHVTILTSQNAKGPSRDWLKFVKTNSARTKIIQWFNKENRDENIKRGNNLLEAAAREAGANFYVLLQDGREKEILEKYNCKTLEHLFSLVGGGGLKEKIVINHLQREYEKTLPPPSDNEVINTLIQTSEKFEKNKTGTGVIVRGIGDTDIRFARCCAPLPGDEIIGFITRGRGLTVHRT